MRCILLPYVGLGDDFIEGLRVGVTGEQGEQPEDGVHWLP